MGNQETEQCFLRNFQKLPPEWTQEIQDILANLLGMVHVMSGKFLKLGVANWSCIL